MSTSGVYAIMNVRNGHSYIGSSVDVEGRLRGHLRALHRGTHCNGHLQGAFKKYGGGAFGVVILESVEVLEELIVREQFYFDTRKPEYNLCPVAGSSLGVKLGPLSLEHRQKIGVAHRGRTHSDEHRRKNSAAHKGKTHSAETRQRMSVARKSRVLSLEHRRRISEALKGRPHSPEHSRRVVEGKARARAARLLNVIPVGQGVEG